MNGRELYPDAEQRRRIMDFIMAAGQTLLDMLALLYVMLRVFYILMYVSDMPTVRSAVWAGAFLVNIAILFVGYR